MLPHKTYLHLNLGPFKVCTITVNKNTAEQWGGSLLVSYIQMTLHQTKSHGGLSQPLVYVEHVNTLSLHKSR